MAVPTLHGVNRHEGGSHVMSCRDNADPLVKAQLLPLFIGTGNSLVAPLSWAPKTQTYDAVLSSSTPPVPTQLTPTVLFNVLKHLQNVPAGSPCAGHTFYLDTTTAKVVFCEKGKVPKNNNTVNLMGDQMNITEYYLSDTVDGATGNPEGRTRLKALFEKTLKAIAAAKPAAPASAPTSAPLGASQGTGLNGVFQRINGGPPAASPVKPSSGPFTNVAPIPRGGVGGPHGARSDFGFMNCDC